MPTSQPMNTLSVLPQLCFHHTAQIWKIFAHYYGGITLQVKVFRIRAESNAFQSMVPRS